MTKSMIPIIDLITLLTVSFLFIANLVGASEGSAPAPTVAPPPTVAAPPAPIATSPPAAPPEPAPAKMRAEEQHSAPAREAREPEGPDTARVMAEVELARTTIARLSAEIAPLRAAIESLRQRVAAAAAREEELRKIGPELAERAAELERLEAEKRQHVQRLAELQAAALAEEKAATATGAPIVQRPQQEAKQRYLLLLTGGRIFPLTKQYFTGRRADGRTVVWPREGQTGLTIDEALKPDSEVLKEIERPEFQETGRVTMLVNPDSFDTFRALRDAVAGRGVEWGWDPHAGTQIVFAETGGKPIPPQGRRK